MFRLLSRQRDANRKMVIKKKRRKTGKSHEVHTDAAQRYCWNMEKNTRQSCNAMANTLKGNAFCAESQSKRIKRRTILLVERGFGTYIFYIIH